MKNYTEHHFVLVLRDVNENTPELEDILFEAGCDDAMISYKNGVVSLTFDRKAANIEDAILSAIGAIESSSLNASVDHIEGAFVTLSEMAERSGFTKQAISLFIQGKRGNGNFPVPFTGVNSTSPIWRWADVLQWLCNNNKIEHTTAVEEAVKIDEINARLYMRKFTNLVSHLTKNDIKYLTKEIKKK
ncbi:MAG: helix-turn-helix transcriptional regulator [Gammaproteobacteria bacterium]